MKFILTIQTRSKQFLPWIPFAHDIVAIFIKLQVKSDGIVRTTAKAVVLRMVAPRVYYLFHNDYLIKFMNWGRSSI